MKISTLLASHFLEKLPRRGQLKKKIILFPLFCYTIALMIITGDSQVQTHAECVFYWKAEAGLGLFLLWGFCSPLQRTSCRSRNLTSTGIMWITQWQHFSFSHLCSMMQEYWSITVNNQTGSVPDNVVITLEKWLTQTICGNILLSSSSSGASKRGYYDW